MDKQSPEELDDDPCCGFGRETWLLIINRRLDQCETLKSETASYIHRMSSWMIGQLFIANAGGLTVQSQMSTREAGAAFASGLVLAMLCALAAWGQAHISYHALSGISDAAVLAGKEYAPEPSGRAAKWIVGLFYATLALGIGSLVAFVIGISQRL